jgi:hypothetical protein
MRMSLCAGVVGQRLNGARADLPREHGSTGKHLCLQVGVPGDLHAHTSAALAHLVDEASAQQLAADARAEQGDVLAAGKPDGGLAWDVNEGAGAASGHVVGSGCARR